MNWLRIPRRRIAPLLSLGFAGLSALAIAACSADQIVSVSAGDGNQTIHAQVGQDISITLGNLAAPEYESPPQMSSDAISFLGAEDVGPFVPAGPTQRFRFRASAVGTAVISFRHAGSAAATVEDTVEVR